MLYKKIFLPEYRNYLKGMVLFVLSAFLITLNSCYTVSEETISPKELYIKDNYTVLEARMKNDSVINLEGYKLTFYPAPQSVQDSIEYFPTGLFLSDVVKDNSIPDIKEGIIKCTKSDTIITTYKGKKEYRFKKTFMEMQFNGISDLKIKSKNTDTFLSVLAWGGLIIGVSTIVFLSIAFAGIRTH